VNPTVSKTMVMAAVSYDGDVQRRPVARLAVEQGALGLGEVWEEAHELHDAEAEAVRAREMRRGGAGLATVDRHGGHARDGEDGQNSGFYLRRRLKGASAEGSQG
jgi:hypothetical protein